MEIKELYIENFGKLSKYRKSFNAGLNSFLEDNGFGKTTLTVFIKAMLYGLDDTRRVSLDENERKKYTPWQGGAYGGWLIFEAGGKSYRIERSFGQKKSDDTFALFDMARGEPSADFSENLGEELFEIDSDGFMRTVFLSEKNISGKNTNQTISAKLGGLVGVEGDIGDFDSAIKLLDDRRRFYQKKGGAGGIADIRAEIYATEDELNILKSKKTEASSLEVKIAEAKERCAKIKAEKSALSEKAEQSRRAQKLLDDRRAYENMLSALSRDEEKEKSLEHFFEKKLPSGLEISEAADALIEAQRLENAHAEAMERAYKKASLSEHSEKDGYAVSFLRVPTQEEIEDATIALENKKSTQIKGLNLSLCIIGILLIILGAAVGFLVNGAMFIFSALGLLLTIVGFLYRGNIKSPSSANTSASDFIKSVYGDSFTFSSELSALIGMRADLERYNAIRAAEEEMGKKLAAAEERIKKCREIYNTFISHFPTESCEPLEEIRTRLAELSVLKTSLNARRADMQKYALSHGITHLSSAEDATTEQNPSSLFDAIAGADDELIAAEREKTELIGEYNSLIRDIEKIDELEVRLCELNDKIDIYTSNLAVITKAKELLAKAKSNMSAKYLGKTYAGFEKYMSLIDMTDDEFTLDTSFTVSKSDMGKLRQAESYSRGTRDLHALALRLSLIDALYENEKPPIILDDPFSAFDDAHNARAAEVLRKLSAERQILYFTCSRARNI